MEEPYLDLNGEDVFESLDKGMIGGCWAALSHSVSLLLLKIRLIRDLSALQHTNDSAVEKKDVPQEVWDGVRQEIMVSSAIRDRKEIYESPDQKPLVNILIVQAEEIYANVIQKNKYMWPALLNPGRHLTARPGPYSMGSVEEMQLSLQYVYSSWQETPGALDSLRRLREAKEGAAGLNVDVDAFQESMDWTSHRD